MIGTFFGMEVWIMYNRQPYAVTDIGHWILGFVMFYRYALC